MLWPLSTIASKTPTEGTLSRFLMRCPIYTAHKGIEKQCNRQPIHLQMGWLCTRLWKEWGIPGDEYLVFRGLVVLLVQWAWLHQNQQVLPAEVQVIIIHSHSSIAHEVPLIRGPTICFQLLCPSVPTCVLYACIPTQHICQSPLLDHLQVEGRCLALQNSVSHQELQV